MDPIKTSPFVVPTTTKKEAPTGNTPMGVSPLQAVTNRFPQLGGNRTTEAPEVVFDLTLGNEGVKTPPNHSSKAYLRRPAPFFQKRLANKQMFKQHVNIITNGYILPFISKLNLARAPLGQSGYKTHQKDLALASCIQSKNTIERVENVKSQVLQSPVSGPQTSPKVEASDRPKHAQHLPTCRKVQNGNSRVHPGLSDSRGMGVVKRLLPSHPHPPKLKELPKVLPHVTGVLVHLPSFWPCHGPTGLHNDCKESEADGPDKWNQTSAIPGQLAYQGPVSESSTIEHSDSGRPDPVQGG